MSINVAFESRGVTQERRAGFSTSGLTFCSRFSDTRELACWQEMRLFSPVPEQEQQRRKPENWSCCQSDKHQHFFGLCVLQQKKGGRHGCQLYKALRLLTSFVATTPRFFLHEGFRPRFWPEDFGWKILETFPSGLAACLLLPSPRTPGGPPDLTLTSSAVDHPPPSEQMLLLGWKLARRWCVVW